MNCYDYEMICVIVRVFHPELKTLKRLVKSGTAARLRRDIIEQPHKMAHMWPIWTHLITTTFVTNSISFGSRSARVKSRAMAK